MPPGTSILHVYDDAADALLILGKPGAGKSTLLVELARELVVRAEVNTTHPLPVILPLSSWAVKRLPLQIWLAEQVAQIYNIPKNVARLWIDEDMLLPLLDGLDEMEEAARPACIAAINTYHRNHLRLPLVVCSRQAEYDEASKSQRLALQNAVVVQPLTYEHVQAYLKQAGKPLGALRRVLATNKELAEIATTPLMVHVLILTYQGTKVERLSIGHEKLQQQVWNDYVQRMIERKRDTRHYSVDQIVTWLGWLARQMRDHNQTIFYLEQLQPDWLQNSKRRQYQWSIILLFALVGGLVGVLTNSNLGGVLFLALICVLVSVQDGRIRPVEEIRLLWKWSLVGLVPGFYIAPLSILMAQRDGTAMPANPLVSGLLMGLSVGLFFGLLLGLSKKQLAKRDHLSPNEGIRRSGRHGLVVGIVSALLFGLLGVSSIGPLPGLLLGLLFGLGNGLAAFIQHFVIRLWLWQTRTFPWKAQQFLDDAVTCILLRRVGGGYSFVHRLLLEYFADLPTRPTPPSTVASSPSGNPPLANDASL